MLVDGKLWELGWGEMIENGARMDDGTYDMNPLKFHQKILFLLIATCHLDQYFVVLNIPTYNSATLNFSDYPIRS